MDVWQPRRVTAGIFGFPSCVISSFQAGGELSWGEENQRSWGKQITASLDRCCCLFLPTGHGYNCVCFDFSQHSPHRLCRGRATIFLKNKQLTCSILTSPQSAVGTWCEEKHQGRSVTFTSAMTLKLHFWSRWDCSVIVHEESNEDSDTQGFSDVTFSHQISERCCEQENKQAMN